MNYQRNRNREGSQPYLRRVIEKTQEIIDQSVGELPKEWKQGMISAIFKKGNRKNAGNYRPVSLTSIICKCMEQCVKDNIVNHMIRNK